MQSARETELPIVIAGAGIGGLCAALALRENGHAVVVMEKASALKAVGAGLQLSPNACAVLDRLGVLSALKPFSFAPDSVQINSGKTGEEIARVPLGTFIESRHGYPFWQVHRADLQAVLVDKVRATDGIDLRLGCQVVDLNASPYDHLTCIYQNTETTGNQHCKALIGADGVWSKVRHLIPAHSNAHYRGQVAYRTTVPLENLPHKWAERAALWLHKDSHLVHYPVRGGKELNIVALVEDAWQDEKWSIEANKEDLLHIFKDWPAEIKNLISNSKNWLKWALCSVDASGPWTHGNIALIGDAAHAMLPYMAQGAAMSIEDASVLANHLPKDVENVPAALRTFEKERKSRAVLIQNISLRNAQTFHYSGPMALARDTVLKLSSPESLARKFDKIYAWKPYTS